MQRRIYPPYFQLPTDVPVDFAELTKELEELDVTDEQLIAYNEAHLCEFQRTVEEFFPPLKPLLLLSALQPFHTTIVRISSNGVIIVYARSDVAKTEVKESNEFAAPDGSTNILDIAAKLNGVYSWFNAQPSRYTIEDARLRAAQDALSGVLEFFWRTIQSPLVFEEICRKLLVAEGVHIERDPLGRVRVQDRLFDEKGTVILQEPSGFRRLEEWGFEFKHSTKGRVSAAYLLEVEKAVEGGEIDVICFMTPDDLTSIGRHLTVENDRIRVWDRSILERLANSHLDVVKEYFHTYPGAVEELSKRLTKVAEQPSLENELAKRLKACPAGREHFRQFEEIGTDILANLFGDNLKKSRTQLTTSDGKQRRDVLFQNKRTSPFFKRLYELFEADFVIVDFKNSGDKIEPKELDVAKYVNKALGRFVLIVSRHGAADAVEDAQRRLYRDDNKLLLIIGDSDVLEMLIRKKRGQPPEDVIEDKLDEFLLTY